MRRNNKEQLDIETSKKRVDWYINQIAQILIEEKIIDNPRELQINMGAELEFNKIFGIDSYKARSQQILADRSQAIGSKDEQYIPEIARSGHLDSQFETSVGNENGRTEFTVEPAFRYNAATLDRQKYSPEHNVYVEGEQELVAYSQAEAISPPMSVRGLTGWLIELPNKIVKKAKDFGIVRVDFTSKTDDQYLFPNSIHLHISVTTVKPEYFTKPTKDKRDNAVNLLSEEGLNEGEKLKDQPSQLLLSIANFRNQFLSEAFLIYAPTEKSYRRFDDNDPGAPKHLGFFKERITGQFGGAGIRGAGRKFSRPQDPNPRVDRGPLRIEDRSSCVEACGHANRDTYPEQTNLAHELIETQLYILWKGTKLWQDNKGSGIKLTEEDLIKQKPPIPKNKGEALALFLKSSLVRELFADGLEGDHTNIPHNRRRVDRVIGRYDSLEKILILDSHPSTEERGPHVRRFLEDSGLERNNLHIR